MKATLSSLLVALLALSAAAVETGPTVVATHPQSGVTLWSAELSLPPVAGWSIDRAKSQQHGLLLSLDRAAEQVVDGQFAAVIHRRSKDRQRRRQLSTIYFTLKRWPEDHDGRELDTEAELGLALAKLDAADGLQGCTVVTAVALDEPTDQVLAFETRPWFDDGKHWALLANGRTERRPIDAELFEALEVELDLSGAVEFEPQTKPIEARLFARSSGEEHPATVYLVAADGRRLELEWELDDPAATDKPDELFKAWAQARLRNWNQESGSGDLLGHWHAAMTQQYGINGPSRRPGAPNRRGRSTDAMALLSGRAAIRETLQTQALGVATGKGEASVEIASIAGVEVEAHPFAEMLGERAGGRLEIADMVPADRLLVYLPKANAAVDLLDSRSDLHHAAASFSRSSWDHRIWERSVERFGLDIAGLRGLLASGAFSEMAVVLPDLFLVDGSEISVLLRLAEPELATRLFGLLGIRLATKAFVSHDGEGRPVYWRLRGDLLIVTTSAAELAAIETASESDDSLGKSAELRYMLGELPLVEDTVAFTYFSDPFIRRLVGPQMKIAQFRRLKARSELEALGAGALLFELDHSRRPTDLEQLVSSGYAAAPLVAVDASFHGDSIVSPRWGRPGAMTTLDELAIETASEAEVEAYANYRQGYDRFWRRFFGPIGLRLDRHGAGSFDLETFILPLVDNTIYNGLRDIVDESSEAIEIPVLDPPPVALMSLRLSERAQVEFLHDAIRGFTGSFGLAGDGLDALGAELHIAVGDADPVLNVGDGAIGELFGRSGDLQGFAIGAVVSLLTRPTALVIDHDDPEAVWRLLESLCSNRRRVPGSEPWFGITAYRIAGERAVVLELSFEEALSMRFGLAVEERHLVITNQPSSYRPRVVGTLRHSGISAGLRLDPSAAELQLQSLWASAARRQREAAMAGIAELGPLIELGIDSQGAADRYFEAFGARPKHPGAGSWIVEDGRLMSTLYGEPSAPSQPLAAPKDGRYGVLDDMATIDILTGFEHDGLRARISLRPGE